MARESLREEARGTGETIEVVKLLHKRIARLEKELQLLRELQALLASKHMAPWPHEEVEKEVKIGNKVLGRIMSGSSHMRVALAEPTELSPEVKEYLQLFVESLRGGPEANEKARAKLTELFAKVEKIEEEVKKRESAPVLQLNEQDGKVTEIRIDNIDGSSLFDTLLTKRALDHAVQINYLLKHLQQSKQ